MSLSTWKWTCRRNTFSHEWFRTNTSFDTEAKGKSEMAYLRLFCAAIFNFVYYFDNRCRVRIRSRFRHSGQRTLFPYEKDGAARRKFRRKSLGLGTKILLWAWLEMFPGGGNSFTKCKMKTLVFSCHITFMLNNGYITKSQCSLSKHCGGVQRLNNIQFNLVF